MFIPSSRIYGIRDTIPFHVQLSGSEESLRAFLQPKAKEKRWYPGSGDINKSLFDSLPSLSTSSPHKSWSDTFRAPTSRNIPLLPPISPSSSPSSPDSPANQSPSLEADERRPTLRVILLRQVTIESRYGRRSWRNQIIGESRPVPVPPLFAASCYSPYGVAEPEEEDHLDWEGDLTIDENFMVGGFQAGNVHVKVSKGDQFQKLGRPGASIVGLPYSSLHFPRCIRILHRGLGFGRPQHAVRRCVPVLMTSSGGFPCS